MGCTHSNLGGNGDTQSFRVYNVNDHGEELHRGTIRICDGDLVLYQKNKNPIRWPLRCLRRYGYDDELFSFESGRRCAVPSGIYAFKCAQAEELFNLVQDSIQRAGELVQPTQHHVQNPPSSNGGSLQLNRQMNTNVHQRVHQTTTAVPPSANRIPPLAGNGGYNSNSHLYVNGSVAQNAGHEYTNTSILNQNDSAFQIDGAAALVDFLHNPPGMGNGRSQVNYAELCMPDSQGSSDANSPDYEAEQQRPLQHTDPSSRLFQPFTDTNLLPGDVLNSVSPEDASCPQSVECEMFPQDALAEEAASTNYVNIAAEENCAAATTDAVYVSLQSAAYPTASTAHPHPLSLPPNHDVLTNYANLALQQPKASKAIKQVNYILIDHKNQNNDCASGGAGNGNNSPISPTGFTPFPESPSRKTESYATIDFDRTVALSNATKPVEDEGGRKTRHNSTIEGIP